MTVSSEGRLWTADGRRARLELYDPVGIVAGLDGDGGSGGLGEGGRGRERSERKTLKTL